MNHIEGIRAVKEVQYEPRKEDIRYFLVAYSDGHLEIEKMVVTNLFGQDNNSPIEQVQGYKYGHPNVNIAINLPYPLFKSREALCEHYRKIFE